MNTNDLQVVREALEEAAAIDKRDNFGDPSMYTVQLEQALAALDRIEAAQAAICSPHVIYEAVGGGMICSGCEQRFEAAQAGRKQLTDEEIDAVVDKMKPTHMDVQAHYYSWSNGARQSLRYARDNGYLAPAPVPVPAELVEAGRALRKELGAICEMQLADGMFSSARKSGKACDLWDDAEIAAKSRATA